MVPSLLGHGVDDRVLLPSCWTRAPGHQREAWLLLPPCWAGAAISSTPRTLSSLLHNTAIQQLRQLGIRTPVLCSCSQSLNSPGIL
jgi:hypothetical protein